MVEYFIHLAAFNPPGNAAGQGPSASEFYRRRSAALESLPRLQGHASGRGRTCIWVCDFSADHARKRELVDACLPLRVCNALITVGAPCWEELAAVQRTRHSSCLSLQSGRPQASQASLLDWHCHLQPAGTTLSLRSAGGHPGDPPSGQPCLSPLSSLACLCWTPWMDLLSGLLPGPEAVLGLKFRFR